MDLSKFAPTIEYTIYIASTPDKVWEVLTSPEWSKRYFFGLGVTLEPRVGGIFMVRNPDGSAHITGEVIAHDPPRHLVVTWDVNWPDLVERLGRTLVTYQIEQAGDAVRLAVIQSNERPLSDDILSGGRAGWPAILSSLKSVLETGKPLQIKMEPPRRMLDALKKMGVKIPVS